jgi:fatty-acyl-CoA synthase
VRLHPVCDHSKDIVKSGGEWISAVDLENQLMAHQAVTEAVVVAIPDERWGERPLAAAVLRDGIEKTELRKQFGLEVGP